MAETKRLVLFVKEGPPWIDLALAHYERRGGVPRLLRFMGEDRDGSQYELKEAVLTGSDVVEKKVLLWSDEIKVLTATPSLAQVGSFLVRGWVDEGRKESFRGWYNPQSQEGFFVIEPKGEEEK